MKFAIRNRWTGHVQFEAEIQCSDDAPLGVKVGFAVRWARESDAVLSDADLSDAVLRDADLSGADLRGADLSGAVLRGAVLSDADLRDADLSGADLRDADLRGADLRGADLRGADLRGAVLRDADLRGAVLRDADLSDADLSGADLSGADLRGADLRSFKADLWMTLTQNANEVPGLVAALRAGRINGSVYAGECACLVGTIAKVKGVDVDEMDRDVSHPAEQWFLMIRQGDKPGDDSAGGFAIGKALEWTLEWCALSGVNPDAPTASSIAA